MSQKLLYQAHLIIVGGTPAGIMAGIAASQQGHSAIILERTTHVGGLPANGLGATDISTRGVAGGLFKEFTDRVRDHYLNTYGEDSPQFQFCSDGFHFEPSVAEKVLLRMLAECPTITVLHQRQFDALDDNVDRLGGTLRRLWATNLETGEREEFVGSAFVDATYEGDLAAACGVPFSTRREGTGDYHEPHAGRVYRAWGADDPGEGSTGEGDDVIQAYNFRLCLTDRPENRVEFPKPATYNREDYASLVEDLVLDRHPGPHRIEREWEGIGRVTNIVWLPNGKTDANNQHLAYVSTDLPEENYDWPRADWAWRDNFQKRLQDYTLGLFWFLLNDPEIPASIQQNARRFGLAADEYADNDNFPRQVYVREGRRIVGEAMFLAHDALPTGPGARPPIHGTSITASHYPVDSHAVRKREPGRDHLDGFISIHTGQYTVPYGIMVPKTMENLWVPVAVSASHLGFGTLRMEPCWMAMGEAAGLAAALALKLEVPARLVPAHLLQQELVRRKAVLIYYKDVARDDPAYPALQYLGTKGILPGWEADLAATITAEELEHWARLAGLGEFEISGDGVFTRGDALVRLGVALGLVERGYAGTRERSAAAA